MSNKLRDHWLRYLVHAGAWVPALYLAWQASAGRFLFDPIKEITIRTGRLAIVFLLLSLACTPVHIVFGFGKVLQVRRALGLYAFAYASAHFLTFAVWDYGLQLTLIWQAVAYQRYIVPGAVALAMLLVLAVTSFRWAQARLGQRWKTLQRSAYLAGVLVILHVMWAAKNPLERLNYGIILAVLLLVRVPPLRRGIIRARQALLRRITRRPGRKRDAEPTGVEA